MPGGVRIDLASAFGAGVLGAALEPLYGRPFELPGSHEKFDGFGLVACSGASVVGVGVCLEDVWGATTEPVWYLYGGVWPEWRNQGIGSSITDRILRSLREKVPSGHVVVSLPPAAVDEADNVSVFWSKRGFVLMDIQVTFAGPPKHRPSDAELAPFKLRVYEGGDQRLDSHIVALTNKMLGSRVGVPPLTISKLQETTSRPGVSCFLVECGDRLAAIAMIVVECGNCYIDTLVVDRAFWGKGAADFFGSGNRPIRICIVMFDHQRLSSQDQCRGTKSDATI